MTEHQKTRNENDEELVEILLDFIVVAANLAKKIYRTMKTKNEKEEISNVENERVRLDRQGTSQCRRGY